MRSFSTSFNALLFWAMACCFLAGLPRLALAQTGSKTAPLIVSYPAVDDNEFRDFDDYFLTQLKLAMDKSGIPYQMEPFRTATFVESRSEYNLRQGRYAVHWLNSNPKREAQLIPIRVPMFKGLIGWRIFLIAQGQQSRFDQITSLSQLQQLTAGQGHDWPDTAILKSNHFRIETSSQWNSLFQMLAIGRTDYFPRSIIEIWREQRIFSDLSLQVENNLALHYHASYYFFVSKKHEAVAHAIEKGLHIALQDGSFDEIFYRRFGDTIRQARLNERRIFSLPTPGMQFPDAPILWFDPTKDWDKLTPPELAQPR